MIVIIEGPDGAGKTKLAEHLCQTFDMAYRHEGPPPTDVDCLAHYVGLLVNASDFGRRSVVFDRMALGERVYGPLLRGEDRLGSGWLAFRQLADRMKALHLVCLPPLDVCTKCWQSRRGKEMIGDLKVFQASWWQWHRQVVMNNIAVYDWTSPHAAMALKGIEATIKERS